MHVVRLIDRPLQRWQNGGGETRELATGGATAAGGFAWRISVATISNDGAFSYFAGVDRSLVRIDGGSLALDINDHAFNVGRHAIRFRGEDHVVSRTAGKLVRVVNVMTDRAGATHQLTVSQRPPRTAGAMVFAIALDDDTPSGLSIGDLVVEPTPTMLGDNGRFAFIAIEHLTA